MRKYLLFLIAMLSIVLIFAQSPPERINYQAVARNATGDPYVNTTVNLIFEIIQTSTGGVVYKETQSDITNKFGLFTSQIGGGTVVAGSFSGISWGLSAHTLRITINGDVIPATQLLSVPYALYAKESLNGPQGLAGINCWDTNNDSFQDLSEDINGDGVWNSLDCAGDSGVAGTAGVNGLSVNWNATQPASPVLNDAYYDSALGQSLIWDGIVWQQMTKDGITPTFFTGPGVTIVGNTISVIDTSVTNEIQSLSINGTNDTIFLTNGGFVPLPANNGLWNANAQGIDYAAGNVGIGIPFPLHKLSVVSSDSVVASFRANSPNFGAIVISNAVAQAPVGTILLSGVDTAIFGMDPLRKRVFLSNNAVNGHVALQADSSVAFIGELVGSFADKIFNKADTIFSVSSTGNNIINANLGTFLTDSLYVLGNNSDSLGYVLTNNGVGQAKWQPSAGGGSLWSPNGANVFLNTGNVGIGTSNPNGALQVNGVISSVNYSGAPKVKVKRAGGTEGAETYLGSSQIIGSYNFDTWDTGFGSYRSSGKIIGTTTTAHGTGDTPSKMSFLTTPQGSATALERLTINDDGNVGIGTSTPSTKLDVAIPSSNTTTPIALQLSNSYSGSLQKNGIISTLSADGTGTKYGLINNISQNTGVNDLYGVENTINHAGSGNIFGIRTLVIGANTTGRQWGVRNVLENTGTGTKEGTSNRVSSLSGANPIYGTRNSVNHDGTGSAFGYTASLTGVSTEKFGIWINGEDKNFFSNNVGIGTQSPGFLLDVAGIAEIDSLRINNSYAFPTAGGTLNEVLTADAAGNATWQTPAAVSSGWNLTGNSGTSLSTDFVGTTDSVDLEFRTNNIVRTRITQKGQIEIFNTGQSVFIGQNAGSNDDLNNRQNVFVGQNAGLNNTSGYWNIALGFESLFTNSTGVANIAIGYQALYTNNGDQNTAVGQEALSANATGGQNSAFGAAALTSNTTGSSNVAVGLNTLHLNQDGSGNTAIGYTSLINNISGSQNTAVGYASLEKNEANNNTVLGSNAGLNNITGSGNLFLGSEAGANELGSNHLFIDNSNTNTPLIWGDFDLNLLHFNGTVNISGAYTLPNVVGANNQVLTTDAVGNVTWQGPAVALTSKWIGTGVTTLATITDKVGIGVLTPAAKLEVVSSSTASSTQDGILNIGISTGNHITIDKNQIQARTGSGASKLFLNNWGGDISMASVSGNVGVGLSSPSSRFHVQDNHASSYAVQISQGDAGGNGMNIFLNNNSGTKTIFRAISTGAAYAFNIMADGNVGLGTSAPEDKLHVENGSLLVNKGHIRSNGTNPSYSGGGGLVGNDIAGRFIIDIGGAETVTFAIPYATAPSVIITPANAEAGASQYHVGSVTTTGFEVFAPTGSPATGIFYYQVIEFNN